MAKGAEIGPASPFFIVADVARAVALYRDRLGFDVRHIAPEEEPIFAIVGRGAAQIFLKAEAGIAPTPNRERHPHLRWDAFIHTQDPDGVAADFMACGATFASPLQETHDGLRGFEIDDADGYRLFFGRPR